MNRKTATLLSLGISIALIAAGIWILYNHHSSFGYGNHGWDIPNHMMMAGGGMGIVVLLFWIAILSAVGLVISGIISSRHTSREADGKTLPHSGEILRHHEEVDQSKGVMQ